MRRDIAEGRPGLGRLLASGTMRLGRQARLSRGQSLALALCLAGAVGLGMLLKPRGAQLAPATAPAADHGAADGGEPSQTDPAAALDRLSAAIAAMNRRLDAVVVLERAQDAAGKRAGTPSAARARGDDARR